MLTSVADSMNAFAYAQTALFGRSFASERRSTSAVPSGVSTAARARPSPHSMPLPGSSFGGRRSSGRYCCLTIGDPTATPVTMVNTITGDESTIYIGGVFSGTEAERRRDLVAFAPGSTRPLPFDAELEDLMGETDSFDDGTGGFGVEALALTDDSLSSPAPHAPTRAWNRSCRSTLRRANTRERRRTSRASCSRWHFTSRRSISAATSIVSTASGAPMSPHSISPPPACFRGHLSSLWIAMCMTRSRRSWQQARSSTWGGGLRSVDGRAHANVAAIDAGSGGVLPWDPRADGSIFALGINAGTSSWAATLALWACFRGRVWLRSTGRRVICSRSLLGSWGAMGLEG